MAGKFDVQLSDIFMRELLQSCIYLHIPVGEFFEIFIQKPKLPKVCYTEHVSFFKKPGRHNQISCRFYNISETYMDLV